MKKNFQISCDINDLQMIDLKLFNLLVDLITFSSMHNIPCNITSLIRPLDGFSTTRTHQEGRAADIAIRHLTFPQKQRLKEYLRDYDKQYDVGAIVNGTSKILHAEPHGTGPHFHLQVRP